MNEPSNISIYSQADVIETLKICDQWGLKPEVQQVVYDFASELMAMSVDQIEVWMEEAK